MGYHTKVKGWSLKNFRLFVLWDGSRLVHVMKQGAGRFSLLLQGLKYPSTSPNQGP